MVNLKVDAKKLEEICRKYRVDFLGVFGSAARGDDRTGSDVDMLVRFGSGDRGGLFELVDMRDELQELLGRKVDLLTEGFLSKYFKDEVLAETKPIYVKTQQ